MGLKSVDAASSECKVTKQGFEANEGPKGGTTVREEHSGLLIDRLAASIVDGSLPLKDVEKELRGSVAEVAIKKRGLGKREVANRCGVTEKSIDNYLKEKRANPKSPEREVARLLQDDCLSLEEIYDTVRPLLCQGRHFTLDDTKRAVDKLIRTGEVTEVAGKKYQGQERPAIRIPANAEAYRELVDEKARDVDYIVLTQKDVREEEMKRRKEQKFSRVVGDTNLVRIDFTADLPESELPMFYEKISAEIARLTLKYEKKKGTTRVRVILGMRTVVALLAILLAMALFSSSARVPVFAAGGAGDAIERAGQDKDSWELDNRLPDPDKVGEDDPVVDDNDVIPADGDDAPFDDRREFPPVFVRGDATLDERLDISDVIVILVHLSQGGPLGCADAADATDDGLLDISDPIAVARLLFMGESSGLDIGRFGPDETQDALGCQSGR